MIRILQRLHAQPASDGAGVRIKRVTPGRNYAAMDPFLMLDELRSQDGSEIAAGFPSHPHRGFETVTYMREGKLEHKDHLGNHGIIEDGGAQWMTAGRGVIHSEMPVQKNGSFHGFQLWLNLPAKEKLRAPEYNNLTREQIPEVQIGAHRIRILGGQFQSGAEQIHGPIGDRTTQPHIWDIELNGTDELALVLAAGLNTLIYVYDGNLTLGTETIENGEMARLQHAGDLVVNSAGKTRFLLLAGLPLDEPVAQYGPFVMNSREEIEQAIADYQTGQLTEAPS